MAARAAHRKFYTSLSRKAQRFAQRTTRWGVAPACLGVPVMAALAMIMFITLFAFGGDYFGWTDPAGRVQLALASSFIFGIICGFRVKG